MCIDHTYSFMVRRIFGVIKMYSDHFLYNSTYVFIHINIYEDMHAWSACHGHANKR